MVDPPCCTEIVVLRSDHDALRKEFEDHVAYAESWRQRHEDAQQQTFNRLFDKLEEALKRPPVWLTAVIGVLTCLVGILAGALWVTLQLAR